MEKEIEKPFSTWENLSKGWKMARWDSTVLVTKECSLEMWLDSYWGATQGDVVWKGALTWGWWELFTGFGHGGDRGTCAGYIDPSKKGNTGGEEVSGQATAIVPAQRWWRQQCRQGVFWGKGERYSCLICGLRQVTVVYVKHFSCWATFTFTSIT